MVENRKFTTHTVLVNEISNNHTMFCSPVRGDNPRVLPRGLSLVQAEKNIVYLFYISLISEIFCAKVCDFWQEWYN